MATQTMQNKAVIAVFGSRQEADQAKQAIQDADLRQRISIDDHVSLSTQLAAQGTTVGGQAGFLMGAFFGGCLGLIATIIAAHWFTGGYPTSNTSRLVVVASAIAGAFFGGSLGKAMLAMQPADQKIKGNPYAPRQFRLLVEGNRDEIRRAQQALGQPVAAS